MIGVAGHRAVVAHRTAGADTEGCCKALRVLCEGLQVQDLVQEGPPVLPALPQLGGRSRGTAPLSRDVATSCITFPLENGIADRHVCSCTQQLVKFCTVHGGKSDAESGIAGVPAGGKI